MSERTINTFNLRQARNGDLVRLVIAICLMITSGGIKFIPHVVTNIFALCLIIVFIIRSKAIFASAMTLKRMILCMIMSATVLLLNLYLNGKNADVISYFLVLLYISISLLFLHICSIDQLVILLKKIGFALNSLVLFSFFLQILFHNAVSRIEINQMRYVFIIPGIFYSSQFFRLASMQIYRVCLIFWEPGVLGVYLVLYLALIIDLKNGPKLLLACGSIILTFSTTANIVMIFLMVYRYRKILTKNWWRYILIVLFAGFLGVLLIVPIIKSKFTGDELSSALVRYYDSEMSMFNALNHPLFGSGMMNADKYSVQRAMRPFRNILKLPVPEEYRKYVLDRSKGGSTNSLFSFAESFGLIVFGFFIYAMFRNQGFSGKKNVFSIAVLISIASEPLLLTPLFLIFFYQGFSDITSHEMSKILWPQRINRSSPRLIMPPNS